MASNDALLTDLSALASDLARATTESEGLTVLARGARGLLPFLACAMALRTAEGWRLWRTTARRPEQITTVSSIEGEAVEALERFLAQDQLLRIGDLLLPPWAEASHREVLWKEGTRSALLLPLVAAGESLGALSFTAAQPDRYGPEHERGASFLAWMMATTLRLLSGGEEPT